MPSAASAARSSRFQSRDCCRGQLEDALADPGERLLRRQAVRGADGEPRLGLTEEAGDTDLEELVQVRGEDRAELDALEERDVLVRCELENACVEVEERELAVEQALGWFLDGADGHVVTSSLRAPPLGSASG